MAKSIPKMARAYCHPAKTPTAAIMTAVLALHGVSVISVHASILSRLVVRTRVPMIAGTLHPKPIIMGIIAPP